MSETNSLNNPNSSTGPTRSAEPEASQTLVASGHAFFERIGVGGMGEVYRCGDDALQRDLAIKVLRAELRGNADAEERFLREARLTGSLQHPGIVPGHNLGRLADGRPCYTMKLVRGRTLAELLRDEAAGPERLPRLLAVVEKVCQAVAFAHSKGIIHRDLKPSNVMVGEFGEVQVMDWGLAKQLSRAEPAPPPGEVTEDVETVGRVEEAEGLSRAGAALGTPSYMPPEQAVGDWDIVDQRADVFALGAILCEVLTGRPPYHGANRDDLLRRARRGDMAEALGRLEKCSADAALVDLCRECLAAERLQRPRHAGVVAERLASYQAEVRERLRQAELERARAEVQAREERKRRRLRAALALAALLLLSGGAVVWWQWQRRQAEADGAAAQVMSETRRLSEEARENPLSPAGYDKAVLAAAKAGEVARAGGASETVKRQADDLLAALTKEAEEAEKDRQLLARLLEVRGPREGPKYRRSDKETMMALAEPTAEELFASAFRDWGLDIDTLPMAEGVVRLKARPAAVVTEVIAALDEWANQRRLDKKPESAGRVAELAMALDAESGSLRRELREIIARDQLTSERALGVLSAALRPVPVPLVVPLGRDGTRLRQLADHIDPAAEPVLGLLTLTRALRGVGEEALAERLLRAALRAHPREVVLYHTLGDLLQEQEPPRWSAAVECYAVARGLRPDLGVNLASALLQSNRESEGLDLLAWLVKERPDNSFLHFEQGNALLDWKHDLDGAIACFHKALELDPKFAPAYNNLGAVLCDVKHDLDSAIACFHKALALDPKYAKAHRNLGIALKGKGDLDGAISSYKKALNLDPKYAHAHHDLGIALHAKGDLDGAIACYHKALNLDPKGAGVHYSLGIAMRDKGRLDEAMAEYRHAIRLKPDSAEGHCNLAYVLQQQGRFDEALASWRRGHELGSKQPGWRYPSAQWVEDAERMLVLDKKLPAILTGEATPANPGEAVALASLCQEPYKKCHATSARLYADAFAAEPKLSNDLNAHHRYNAACSAALAAAGRGEYARLLPDKVAAMFRGWALAWLRDDLTAYAKLAGQNNPAMKQFIQQRLVHWKGDSDLVSVRDGQALDLLAENERDAWRALWRDMDELLKRVSKKDEPTKGLKESETPKAQP
jgi:serine/threonine-protein kinase